MRSYAIGYEDGEAEGEARGEVKRETLIVRRLLTRFDTTEVGALLGLDPDYVACIATSGDADETDLER